MLKVNHVVEHISDEFHQHRCVQGCFYFFYPVLLSIVMEHSERISVIMGRSFSLAFSAYFLCCGFEFLFIIC